MPRPFSRTEEHLLSKKASSGEISSKENAVNPVTIDFSHFEFPELKGENVGDEVMVVLRGYVSEVRGAKKEKNREMGFYGEPNTTCVRFSRASVVHGQMHGKRMPIRNIEHMLGDSSAKRGYK